MLKNNTTRCINTDTIEGKLLISALAILTSQTYVNQTPDTVINNIEMLANKIFHEDEMNLREDIKKLITSKLEKKYYNDSNIKAGDDVGIPDVVMKTIDDEIDHLFNALEKHGLFTNGPYQH